MFAENEDSMDQGGEDTRDPDPNNDSDGKNGEMVEEKKKANISEICHHIQHYPK